MVEVCLKGLVETVCFPDGLDGRRINQLDSATASLSWYVPMKCHGSIVGVLIYENLEGIGTVCPSLQLHTGTKSAELVNFCLETSTLHPGGVQVACE